MTVASILGSTPYLAAQTRILGVQYCTSGVKRTPIVGGGGGGVCCNVLSASTIPPRSTNIMIMQANPNAKPIKPTIITSCTGKKRTHKRYTVRTNLIHSTIKLNPSLFYQENPSNWPTI